MSRPLTPAERLDRAAHHLEGLRVELDRFHDADERRDTGAMIARAAFAVARAYDALLHIHVELAAVRADVDSLKAE